MSISILNRGASGGLKPELTVTAPSGSTIDILQNGIIVDAYTLSASETEHTFIVKVGAYTVRGTLGTQTKSVEVVIDPVGRYAVEISYILWLYREGDECEDVTGGWSFDGYGWEQSQAYQNNKIEVKNADSISANFSDTGYGLSKIGTQKAINTAGYSKLCCLVDSIKISGYSYSLDLGGNYSKVTSAYAGPAFGYAVGTIGNNILCELDISTASEPLYISLGSGANSGAGSRWIVYKVWLE